MHLTQFLFRVLLNMTVVNFVRLLVAYGMDVLSMIKEPFSLGVTIKPTTYLVMTQS